MKCKELPKAILESEVNVNGETSITHPANINKDQAGQIAVELIKQALSRKLSCKKTGVTVQMMDGQVWSTQGSVNVGNLFFEVDHDVENRCSAAKVDIEPETTELGNGLVRARISAYVHPNRVYVTAEDPRTGQEKMLSLTRFEGMEISTRVCDSNTELDCRTDNMHQVKHPGFAKWNN